MNFSKDNQLRNSLKEMRFDEFGLCQSNGKSI